MLWQTAVFANRQSTRDVLGMATSAVQMLVLALPLLSTPYVLYRVSRRLVRALWNWSKPTPMRRLGGGLITAGAIALVAVQSGEVTQFDSQCNGTAYGPNSPNGAVFTEYGDEPEEVRNTSSAPATVYATLVAPDADPAVFRIEDDPPPCAVGTDAP